MATVIQRRTVVSTQGTVVDNSEKIMMIVIMAVVVIVLVVILVWWLFTRDQPVLQPITPSPPPVTSASNGQASAPSVPSGIQKIGLSDGCDSSTSHGTESKSTKSISDRTSSSSCDTDSKSKTKTSSSSCETDSNTKSISSYEWGDTNRSSSSTKQEPSRQSLQAPRAKRGLGAPRQVYQELTRESRTRSDTGEIEVYTIGANRATKARPIQCPDGCVPTCMLGGEVLYVHMEGDVHTSGVYNLEEGEWKLLAPTADKQVTNMYTSNRDLILVTDDGNFRVDGDKLVLRTGHTYDKHTDGEVTTTVTKSSDGKYTVLLDGKKVDTLGKPCNCRVHQGGLVYLGDDGQLEGTANISNVSAFDSNGSELAFIKESTLGLLFPESAPRTVAKTHCTMIAIAGNTLYCSA